MRTLMLIALILQATPAHAGRLTGRVAANAPSNADACDTLGVQTATPHTVHARIMAGTTHAWEDSFNCNPGAAWDLYYPDLDPGTYQASSWTTKATNDMVGCPEVLDFTVAPRYSIIFGWTTIGAVYNNREGRVIGAAEMLRLLNACEGRP